jgi:Mg2+-importing ATPase
MYFIICPAMCGGLLFHQITDPAVQGYYIALFQAGWFVESMWTQTLVIHLLRTPKIPFIQSHASAPVTLLSFTGIAVLTVIPFTGFGASIGFAALPPSFFLWLSLTIILYMGLVTVFKRIFVKRYGELL